MEVIVHALPGKAGQGAEGEARKLPHACVPPRTPPIAYLDMHELQRTTGAPVRGAHWFDLQLFAAEDEGRTEEGTAKRVGKARGEGQVAKSVELNQVLGLFAGALTMTIFLPKLVGYELHEMRYWLENIGTLELSIPAMRIHFSNIALHMVLVLWPIALVEMAIGVGANIAQVGWLFTWQPLMPQWGKIFPNPGKLFGRMVFGEAAAFNFAKSVLKIIMIGYIAWSVVNAHRPELMKTWGMQIYPILNLVVMISYELTWKICLFLLLIAAADYFFNRHTWKESMKMKREEVKDETKQAEGDPQVKQAQRRKMIQAMRRRMMKDIPTADVVITNPTHYAIAIKYDQATMTAPKCVAKGEGFIALKIRQIADQNGIPIVENKPLAQALYKSVEIGDQVPPEFYQAIAEVLAYVYKTKRKIA